MAQHQEQGSPSCGVHVEEQLYGWVGERAHDM